MKNCFKVIEAATVLYVLDLSARNLWKLVILKTALFESIDVSLRLNEFATKIIHIIFYYFNTKD